MRNLSVLSWYKSKINKTPNWLLFNIGIISVVIGLLLLSRPFSSLRVLLILVGVALFVEGVLKLQNTNNKYDKLISYIYLISAIVVAFLPGTSISVIAFIIGVLLFINGVSGIFAYFRHRRLKEIYKLFISVSYAILGFLALTWPDVATIVIALVFGVKLFWFGLNLLFKVLSSELLSKSTKKNKDFKYGYLLKIAGSSLLILLSLGLLFFSNQIQSKNADIDSFYEISSEVPKEPGKIIKIEEYTQAVPDNAKGWRFIYTTTTLDNEPAVSSAFVMTSKKTKSNPQPVIAWTHGTTGYAQQCAPTNLPEPFPLDGVTPDLPAAINAGYIVVGTDYMGLGTEDPHPYLIGEPVARATLDSIRALSEIPELNPDNKNFVWGHSQGGGTALWTGEIAEEYAPELEMLGIIAAAPASDVPALLDRSKDSPVGKILGAFTVTAYSNIYENVSFNEYIKPSVQPIVREMAKRCFSEAETLVSILTSLVINGSIYDRDPLSGPFGDRLEENIPTKTIDTPIFIAQGATDVLVFPDIQESYTENRCENGQKIEYKIYDGLDHVGVVGEGSPFRQDALAWTNDRLNQQPFKDNCSEL
jgi:uncharacterized membrane protein HdeD (DUF308 family)/alpha-beta hydrolase superfamily lysophospholipase